MNIIKIKLTALFIFILMIISNLSACNVKNEKNENYEVTDVTDTTGNGTTDINADEASKDELSGIEIGNIDWSDSIKYAASMKNAVNGKFTTAGRGAFEFSNSNAVIIHDLSGLNTKLITSLSTQNGKTYLSNTMDTFLIDKNSLKYYSSASPSSGRMNSFRLGYYYYDVHILNLGYSNGDTESKIEPLDVGNFKKGAWGANMATIPTFDDGIMRYEVKDLTDPYVYYSGSNISTDDYNGLEITMRCKKSTFAFFYLIAGSQEGFNAEQNVGFTVVPGDEFITYSVPFDSIPDYTGALKGIRLDCGSTAGEIIEVQSIKAVKLNSSAILIKLDRMFHTYSDKIHQELRFLAAKDIDNLGSYGTETKILKSTVEKLMISDKNGAHEDLSSKDSSTVEFVAFDIKDTGVFGYIFPNIIGNDETVTVNGEVTVTDDGEYYIICQEQKYNSDILSSGKDCIMANRIYTDITHDFEGIKKETYIERNPLTDVFIAEKIDGATNNGYDAVLGAYVYNMDGSDFNAPYYDQTQKHYKTNTVIVGDDVDRNIYIYSSTIAGCLECAAVLDQDENLLPLQVEVCKNFQGEKEEPLYYPEDISYGDTIFPLKIKKAETLKFTILNLYQNWGVYPLKQLSSIQFHIPYYHLSVGVTETNCIAPYFVYSKDTWTLPDFRALSSVLWDSQPQHTSVGRLHFLNYIDTLGNKLNSESQCAEINSAGPVYADINMDYLSDDGKIKAEYRHMEMPQTDETRTYYSIKLTILEDLTIKDFKNNFSFFSFDGRSALFNKLGFLDKNNKSQVKAVDINNGSFSEFISLGSEGGYFDYFGSTNTTDIVNFALIIKDSNIIINGEKYEDGFILKNSFDGSLNLGALTLDIDDVSFKKGDVLELNIILLPWGNYDEQDDSKVIGVRNDSILNPFTLNVSIGSLIEDKYLPKVQAIGNGEEVTAEYTVSGGKNNVVTRVYGFSSYERVKIFEKFGEEYKEYKTNNYNYDGIQIYYDQDGTYSFAFVADMLNGEARTFKVVGK